MFPERGLIHPRHALNGISIEAYISPLSGNIFLLMVLIPQLRYACSGLRIEVSFQDTPWMNDYHSKYLINHFLPLLKLKQTDEDFEIHELVQFLERVVYELLNSNHILRV